MQALNESKNKNSLKMHPFLIYVLVLTIAYALYFGTMITMDLTSKKKVTSSEETIPTDDMEDMAQQLGSKSIVENADGGFSVETYSAQPFNSESEDSDLFVSSEEQNKNEEYSSVEQDSVPGDINESQNNNDFVPEVPEVSEESTDLEKPEYKSDDQEPSQENQEESNEVVEEESSNINNYTFSPEEEFDLLEPQDEGPAFDSSLSEPQYDIREIYESNSSSVAQKATSVNSALSPIEPKTDEFSSSALREIIQAGDAEEKNIEVKNEYTNL